MKVDFKPGHVVFQTAGEISIVGDLQAVRIEHQVLDRPCLGEVEDLEKFGMNRRFAPADLHHIRLAFISHHAIQHEFNLIQRTMCQSLRRAFAVADRAGEIALVGHFNQRKARVLLVIGAEAAVVGAAVFDRRVEMLRHLPGLEGLS